VDLRLTNEKLFSTWWEKAFLFLGAFLVKLISETFSSIVGVQDFEVQNASLIKNCLRYQQKL